MAVRDRDERMRLAGNRVAAHPACECDEAEGRRLVRRGENATERLDRVRASFGDVLARVATLRSRDRDPKSHVARADRLEPEREPEERVVASRATHRECLVAGPVEVDEQAAGDE